MKVQLGLFLMSLAAIFCDLNAAWNPPLDDPRVLQAVDFINEHYRNNLNFTTRVLKRIIIATVFGDYEDFVYNSDEFRNSNGTRYYDFLLLVQCGNEVGLCNVMYKNEMPENIASLITEVSCAQPKPF